MKEKRLLFLVMFFSILIGWGLGFLRLPLIDAEFSFLVGFLSCLALVALILLVTNFKNKTINEVNAQSGLKIMRWLLLALFILIAGILTYYQIIKQNTRFEAKLNLKNELINEQAELLESNRQGKYAETISNLVKELDLALRNNNERSLTESQVDRIVATNYALKPYRSLEGDTLSVSALSPERGQLLLHLTAMNLDSVSFYQIKKKTSFAHSDLRKADLNGVDLSHIDLSHSNLKDAHLENAKLNRAKLEKAILWGADLRKSNLSKANLKRTDLRWADLDGINLKGANLDGANLSSAKVRKANVSHTKFQWADLHNAMFNDSNLKKAYFFGSNLSKANLSNANLTGANLRRLTLMDAKLSDADLTHATVEEENWLDKISDWRVTGADQIRQSYSIVADTTRTTKFMLKRKAE